MKIAFIVWRFPVLSEAFILNQITGLIDRGHDVYIHPVNGLPKNYTGKVHPVVEEYKLLEHTYFPPTVPENFVWRFCEGIGLLFKNFHRGSWKTLRFFTSDKYGEEVATVKTLYRVENLLQDGNYDIIHCQFGTLAPIALAYREAGIISGKLITTFRGIDISKYVQENGINVYDQLFRDGEFFLANCKFFGDRAIKLGCNPDKIVIHGSGLDCSKFSFKSRYFPVDGNVQIATTGRLVEKKGIEYVIRAVAQIALSYPNIEYNILGDGELKEQLEKLITELNVGHIIKLLGWKQQKEIVEILDNAHIFIAPSVTAADGNQDAPVNTLKEAMAMGLPVISTRHGGIPELVEDGVSGFLVPERDADAIAHKLSYLIEHPELWVNMGKAGRARVEEKYDTNKLNDELVAIYQQVLNPESPPTILPQQSKELTHI
ncbi:colanic acid biosynthesis glycosyltransferase WcaL [Fortiea sp. LEGE XX443]|uniref:colanic acid biosynthesis glycosyltransferase WcaL n=1 Tax=Fortiea sp. LEGE XX443 TaxID=1828611 RepID=UPI00188122E1|nr:colanic acid biosynthesis glycosyltransferase WcaL [Fortiea sp. LEGE XX443]MBE9004671.1 colanic acid biosynthesis glycosyltransferase WcaL [Fortiea sp. LEGE XX443]